MRLPSGTHGAQVGTETGTPEGNADEDTGEPRRRLRTALQTREYLVDAKNSQAAPRLGPAVWGHIGGRARARLSRAVPAPSHLQRQEDGAAHHFASEHSQHPASSRVQVQLSERKPGPFLPLIALHCCSRSLHSPYIHLSLNYKLGN